jgi:uncharacterized protein YjbJ (UPF0337 family)
MATIKNAAEVAAGEVKETTGKVVNNDELAEEGQEEKQEGTARQEAEQGDQDSSVQHG